MDAFSDFEQWKWKAFWPKFADLSARDRRPAPPPEGGQASQEPIKAKTRNGKGPEDDGTEDPNSEFVVEYIMPADFEKHRQKWDKVPLHLTSKHFREWTEFSVSDLRPLWRDPDLSSSVRQIGSTMHLELDVAGSGDFGFDFKTGDNVAILPMNTGSLVKAIAKQLDYDLDAMFVLKPKEGGDESDFELPFPTPCTVRDFLSKYCELSTPPRRSVIRALSKFATDFKEREELYSISSKKHRNEYLSKVIHEHIGLADFITKNYKSIEIPLVKFIGICPPLQPRWYSSSNSNLMHRNNLHITLAVVSIPRSIGNSYTFGVASHHLSNLQIGEKCKIVKTSNSGFVCPDDVSTVPTRAPSCRSISHHCDLF